MNKKGIGFGIFLLGVGVIWLLVNLNLISINVFSALCTLWPLILVVVGVNIIFKENSIIRGLSWLAFLIIVIIYGSLNGNAASPFYKNWTFNSGDTRTTRYADEPMRTGLEKGSLNIDAGAVQLNISDEKDKLVILDAGENNIRYDINYSSNGNSVKIDVDNVKAKVVGTKSANVVDMKLNDRVVWNIKMDTGASNGNIDLSKLKISNLDIEAGAVNYAVKLGGNVPATEVKLESGASNFEFDIPNDVGVKVKLDGALNNTNFSELGWTKSGSTYESLNYSNAKSKINMDAEIGVAKLRINYN